MGKETFCLYVTNLTVSEVTEDSKAFFAGWGEQTYWVAAVFVLLAQASVLRLLRAPR